MSKAKQKSKQKALQMNLYWTGFHDKAMKNDPWVKCARDYVALALKLDRIK